MLQRYRTKIFTIFLPALTILFMVTACDSNLIFEKNIPIKGGTWASDQPVDITFNITDTIQPVNIYINIRHATSYPNSNLYLFVDTWYPNQQHTRDTLEFLLAEPDGKWLGSGFGKIKSLRVPIVKGIRFPQSGEYTIQLLQAMRVDNLEGMEDIGIRIEKMQDNQ